MGKAKDIILQPITSKDANNLIKKVHYSGKVVNNSQLHIGVFLDGSLEGAMQFGPSMDKKKLQGLVSGTGWNEFIELNRMAFTDNLPRNSESRAISVAMKMLRKHAPHIKWVISFSDACQCGDGTIYRASGFVLTGIKVNDQIWVAPDGTKITRLVATNMNKGSGRQALIDYAKKFGSFEDNGNASMLPFKKLGYKPLVGFQLRYIYFIDKEKRKDLTVKEIPFDKIKELGATMYKGKRADD